MSDSDHTQAPSIHHEIQPSNDDKDDHKGFTQRSSTDDREVRIKDGPGAQEDYDYLAEKEAQGAAKFHKLGWIKLVVVLIVEAIALGSLSIPK